MPMDDTRRHNRQRRSRTGCLNCRRQRIKCDENYPSCRQCEKRNRGCDISGSRFRVYKGASANDVAKPTEPPKIHDATLSGPSNNVFHGMRSPTSTTEDTGNSLDVLHGKIDGRKSPPSPGLSTVHDLGRVLLQLAQPSPASTNQSTPSMIPHSASPYVIDFAVEPSELTHIDPQTNNSHDPASSPSTAAGDHRLDHVHSMYFARNTPLRSAQSVCHTEVVNELLVGSPGMSTKAVETNVKLSFFLRHFSETLGKWMDLFDLDYFYSRHVPMLALESPLVMYSACALAAKQLAKVRPSSNPCTLVPSVQNWPDSRSKDYSWYSTEYYDAAISLLLERVSDLRKGGSQNSALNPSYPVDLDTTGLSEIGSTQNQTHQHTGGGCSDEIVVAATILSVYEFLSASEQTWSEHLDGIRLFIQLSDDAGFFSFQGKSPSSRINPLPPSLLRAAFWIFARQDFFAALINRTRTRLDTDDPLIWRHMGLSIDMDGHLTPSTHFSHGSTNNDLAARADDISNALVWLLSKLANYMAMSIETGKTREEYDGLDTSMSTGALESSWAKLNRDIDKWYKDLPSFFRPCYQVRLKDIEMDKCRGCQHRSESLIRHETWYSNSMCASAMQCYHMAQMLLLIHKPPGSLAPTMIHRPNAKIGATPCVSDPLTNFHQMNKLLQHHAVEICAISLSRLDDAARINMIQPLYVAGRCLVSQADRAIIIQLLENVEQELGWSTKHKVDSLLGEWDIS